VYGVEDRILIDNFLQIRELWW